MNKVYGWLEGEPICINMSLKNFALLLSIIWQLAQESVMYVFVCQICGILLILYIRAQLGTIILWEIPSVLGIWCW